MSKRTSGYLFEDRDALDILEQRNYVRGYKTPRVYDPQSDLQDRQIIPITETVMSGIVSQKYTYDDLLDWDVMKDQLPDHVLLNWLSYASLKIFKNMGCIGPEWMYHHASRKDTPNRLLSLREMATAKAYMDEVQDYWSAAIVPKSYRWHDRIHLYKANAVVSFLYIHSTVDQLPTDDELAKRVADELSEHEGFQQVIDIANGGLLRTLLRAEIIQTTELI